MRANRLLIVAALLLLASGASAEDLNQAGAAAYQRGDFTGAERLFREGLRRTPRDAVLHYHLGVTLVKLSRYREAADSFQAAIRLQPSTEIEAAAREALRALRPLLTARTRDESDAIRVRRVGGVWVAEVLVNDRYPATFLVDTGASLCVVSPRIAEMSGIRPQPDAQTLTMITLAGKTTGRLISVPLIRVGDIEARDVPAVVHPTGDHFDGILGNTFLGRYNATLDQKRGVLSLEQR